MSENETLSFVPYPAEDQFMNCCCVDLEAEKRMKRDCYYFFDFPIFGTHIYMCRKTGLYRERNVGVSLQIRSSRMAMQRY